MYPEGDIKVGTNFHSNPSNTCWDISLKTANVNLMVVLEKKKSSLETTSVQNLVPIHPGVGKIFYRIPENFDLLVVSEESARFILWAPWVSHEYSCCCRLQLNTMIKVKTIPWHSKTTKNTDVAIYIFPNRHKDVLEMVWNKHLRLQLNCWHRQKTVKSSATLLGKGKLTAELHIWSGVVYNWIKLHIWKKLQKSDAIGCRTKIVLIESWNTSNQ